MPAERTWRDIRPVAVGVVRRGEDLLVERHRDAAADETFYRPVGGGIEFGEPAAAALRREFREELGWELRSVTRLGVLENRFEFDGTPGHEFVVVFEADPVDDGVYDVESFRVVEDSGETFEATWQSPATFEGPDAPPLYPDGLPSLLGERHA